MNDSQLIWEAYGEMPGYADTTWQDTVDGQVVKITMQDVEAMLNQLKVPQQGTPVPTSKIAHLDIHTKHKDSKSPEEQQATYDRAMKADMSFAIIASMKDGVYNMILDGNHRLHKAVATGVDTINVRTLDLSQTPPDWQHVFR